LGTTAPVGSSTVPLIEPEFHAVCPSAAQVAVVSKVTAKMAANRHL
jgi:hypothetical protein